VDVWRADEILQVELLNKDSLITGRIVSFSSPKNPHVALRMPKDSRTRDLNWFTLKATYFTTPGGVVAGEVLT
jgi:hypothetical protein